LSIVQIIALNFQIELDGAQSIIIKPEREPCSKDLLESMDLLIYALITDSQYKLPQYAPDGNYSPEVE
jgi:hypothetical protein|tara:strand:+ start:536 stop:739 length:204 start_codon:yes stop_codon:yes gene_type:complete